MKRWPGRTSRSMRKYGSGVRWGFARFVQLTTRPVPARLRAVPVKRTREPSTTRLPWELWYPTCNRIRGRGCGGAGGPCAARRAAQRWTISSVSRARTRSISSRISWMGSASGRSVVYRERSMRKCVFVERMDRAIVPVINTGNRIETLRDVLTDEKPQ